MDLTFIIQGQPYPLNAVQTWESKRLRKAAAKIGLPVPDGSLEDQRRAFADAKLALGPDEIRRRLRRDLTTSDLVAAATARISRGRRAMSVCEIRSTTGRAADFVSWFLDTTRPDYERSMIAAHPDHFLIRTAPDGTQEVVETTGGSPAASRLLIDYTDISTLRSVRDPAYDLEAAGVAHSGSGLPVGGVRHQFRDRAGGFHARLCVEFPQVVLPRMVSQHRWHLATEWANWITFAFHGLD
ncbi:hypothetical protein [Nonomuraea soli]|uniref:Uncharacterized protein n=1 Tax=Nonomuraea soli TaxID=1032476 RepID=A0A7W0CV29_9ACTN|nr:hypothetical protein [Nonomuraea soli]MBA2897708.1 hypothetical protein [Nonomuraea soli]